VIGSPVDSRLASNKEGKMKEKYTHEASGSERKTADS